MSHVTVCDTAAASDAPASKKHSTFSTLILTDSRDQFLTQSLPFSHSGPGVETRQARHVNLCQACAVLIAS